jgi:hypothetical protein
MNAEQLIQLVESMNMLLIRHHLESDIYPNLEDATTIAAFAGDVTFLQAFLRLIPRQMYRDRDMRLRILEPVALRRGPAVVQTLYNEIGPMVDATVEVGNRFRDNLSGLLVRVIKADRFENAKVILYNRVVGPEEAPYLRDDLPLIAAAEKGNVELYEYILERGFVQNVAGVCRQILLLNGLLPQMIQPVLQRIPAEMMNSALAIDLVNANKTEIAVDLIASGRIQVGQVILALSTPDAPNNHQAALDLIFANANLQEEEAFATAQEATRNGQVNLVVRLLERFPVIASMGDFRLLHQAIDLKKPEIINLVGPQVDVKLESKELLHAAVNSGDSPTLEATIAVPSLDLYFDRGNLMNLIAASGEAQQLETLLANPRFNPTWQKLGAFIRSGATPDWAREIALTHQQAHVPTTAPVRRKRKRTAWTRRR